MECWKFSHMLFIIWFLQYAHMRSPGTKTNETSVLGAWWGGGGGGGKVLPENLGKVVRHASMSM